jgi:phosphinothricin acetyltransferase
MSGIVLKQAGIETLPWIVEVYNSTIAGRMVTADTHPVTVEEKTAWFQEHHGKRPLWIVEAEGKPIGWASLQDFYGRPAYSITAEISIYLEEGSRGKGWGRQVLQAVTDRCAGLGIHNLVGYIFEHNLPSLKLFEQAGFERWARLPDIAVLDGITRSLVIVGKRVSTAAPVG